MTINRVAYRLTPKTVPEPDLAVVLSHRVHTMKHGYVEGAPDVAVELVSPESVDRDYELKRSRYEEAGVGEYWIIDPDESTATFFLRGEAGFTEAKLDGTLFRSTVIPGFVLDTRWLWQKPLPAALPIIQSMLAHA